MNYVDEARIAASRMSAVDQLLIRIAIRIQLTPTSYGLACKRFETIENWLLREGSEIAPLIEDFYVQGSFSLGATIRQAKRSRSDDGFDIDSMLQIRACNPALSPNTVLDLLFRSIDSHDESRYADKVTRRSRCVTIDFAELHFDVTPTVLAPHAPAKTGWVFQSKLGRPRSEDKLFLANPYGFAAWFNGKVGLPGTFGSVFEQASLAYDRSMHEAAGENASSVPEQVEAYRKPLAVIALQLLKRWRCVNYDRRNDPSKLPPSVLFAYFAAMNAGHSISLCDELRSLAVLISTAADNASSQGKLLAVSNPRCFEDLLTDRWPANDAEQSTLARELDVFVRRLDEMENASLAAQREILIELFGEAPAANAVASIIEERDAANRLAGPLTLPGRATIPVGLGSAINAPAGVRSAPKHRNFGDGP